MPPSVGVSDHHSCASRTRIPHAVVLVLLSLLSLFRVMAAHGVAAGGIVPGTYAQCKVNRARSTTDDTWVCIKAVDNNTANNTATVGVFADEADATAVAARLAVGADAAATQAAHDDALTRELASHDGVTKRVLGNMVATASFDALISSAAPPPPPPPVDPLVGTTVTLTVPVMGAGGALIEVFTGACKIASVSTGAPDAYDVTFTLRGTNHTAIVSKAAVAAASAVPPPPASSPIALDPAPPPMTPPIRIARQLPTHKMYART